MDPNALAAARAGKPMLPLQQQVPTRYPLNSYYTHPPSMPYQQQPQMQHRSLSQGPTPTHAISSATMSSNGLGGKSTLIEPVESKTESMLDDSSNQQQQQQIFHPLLQNRSRSQTPSFYPNMPPTNSPYFPPQRPVTPASDYNMVTARGIRPTNIAYGTVPVQRIRTPLPAQLSSTVSDPMTCMNNNPIGLQPTPPPPSVNPR